jgi:hypothetical protein
MTSICPLPRYHIHNRVMRKSPLITAQSVLCEPRSEWFDGVYSKGDGALIKIIMSAGASCHQLGKIVIRRDKLRRFCPLRYMSLLLFLIKDKVVQIHNLYVVVIKGTKNLLHSLNAVVTLHGGIGRPPVWKTGDTHSWYFEHIRAIYTAIWKSERILSELSLEAGRRPNWPSTGTGWVGYFKKNHLFLLDTD